MASGGTDAREALRLFLNKECIWKKSSSSTEFLKIYTATTAISAVYKPLFKKKLGCHALNITALLMKPKEAPTCATIYINGLLSETCTPEVIFTRPVPGQLGLVLIYFGPFSNPKQPYNIPMEPTIVAPQEVQLMTRLEMLDTSTPIPNQEIINTIRGVGFVTVGKCVWFDKQCFYTFCLSMEYMMCCPHISGPATLSTFVNLLTRCDNPECVPCYGKKLHANVAGGYTNPSSPGSSEYCPCLLSCASLKPEPAPITGNKNLLSLLFGPLSHHQVTHLKFFNNPRPKALSEVIAGISKDGKHIPVKVDAWVLLKMSAFYSRCTLYGCQILKRVCLHSY